MKGCKYKCHTFYDDMRIFFILKSVDESISRGCFNIIVIYGNSMSDIVAIYYYTDTQGS